MANQGLTPSGGWVKPIAGVDTNGVHRKHGTWVTTISPDARWVWHRANGDLDPTMSNGFDHDEYLIFRFRISSGTDKNCFICPAGSYCLGAASSSTLCPAGTIDNKIGAKSSADCNPDAKI